MLTGGNDFFYICMVGKFKTFCLCFTFGPSSILTLNIRQISNLSTRHIIGQITFHRFLNLKAHKNSFKSQNSLRLRIKQIATHVIFLEARQICNIYTGTLQPSSNPFSISDIIRTPSNRLKCKFSLTYIGTTKEPA